MLDQLLAWAPSRVLPLLEAWHSAPLGCRQQLSRAVATCVGGAPDQSFILSLELSVVCLVVIVAFLLGRFTAELDFLELWSLRRHGTTVVKRGPVRSRFDGD